MSDWLQMAIVGLAVVGAVAYMTRMAIRKFKGRCGDGGCSGCATIDKTAVGDQKVNLTVSGRSGR